MTGLTAPPKKQKQQRQPIFGTYQQAVCGGFGRVHDEVAQREAEALGRPAQEHSLGSRPGELLLCGVRPRRGAGQVAPLWGFILHKGRESVRQWNYSCFHFYLQLCASDAVQSDHHALVFNIGKYDSKNGWRSRQALHCDLTLGQYIFTRPSEHQEH